MGPYPTRVWPSAEIPTASRNVQPVRFKPYSLTSTFFKLQHAGEQHAHGGPWAWHARVNSALLNTESD